MDPLTIAEDVALREYSTMRLGGTAAYAMAVSDRISLMRALDWARERGLPILMIGSGSNIVWKDEGFPGLLLVNRFSRREVFEEDTGDLYLTVGAGDNWDDTVAYSVSQGLTGIECLSFIPGTCGATPIQNVGAYGQEIADVLVTVEAFDMQSGEFVTLRASDCGFGYRTSRFKTTDRGRFFITAITMHLRRAEPKQPFYRALQKYLDDHAITTYTPQVLRDAVITIRSSKLPDPREVANNGSFFANPIVEEGDFVQIAAGYEDPPHWPTDDGRIKLSAAWLIETAGFKDHHDPATGMGTWPSQPLVLVNEHAKSTADLMKYRQAIVDKVKEKFGVTLQQEPELLPA
jgi:UDP-N-acetylmuramate dehydrogenase